MVVDVLVIFAVGLLAAVLNVILGSLLRHVSPRRIVADLTRLDVVGLTFAGLGASSLALSYHHGLWVGGARRQWWEAFHLELGAAFVVLGAIELLIVGQMPESGRARPGDT